MPRTITLIRHAETQANAERRWQGSLNAPFSDRGLHQIERLADRFPERPRRLIASDLPRTASTAAALGEPELDAAWREFDVGGWEGLTSEEIAVEFPGELERLTNGDDFAIGGGEHLSVFRERIAAAFDALVDDLDDGDDAVVVTHGGVIWTVVNRVLDPPSGSAPVIPSHNTAVTRIRIADDGSRQLFSFNDATHLDDVPTQFGPEGVTVTVFRHGQTHGNVAGRWQGRSDSDLTDHGVWQASEASRRAPRIEYLYTSPLGRASSTAAIIGRSIGVDPVAHDGLAEMSFGTWENLTLAEASEAEPDLFAAIYGRGEDLRRGGDGESFTEAGERFGSTLRDLVARNGHRSLGAVSHGAVIRAFAVELVGLGFADRDRLPVPRNSSMSRFVYAERGAALASYNVAPHLDPS